MFGKWPKRMTTLSWAATSCAKTQIAAVTNRTSFVFINFLSLGECCHESSKRGRGVASGGSRLSERNTRIKASVMLEHQLETYDNLIELIIAKLRIRLSEIRPGVNVIRH